MTYTQLFDNIMRKRSFLCVGLDSSTSKIPEHLRTLPHPMFEFNKAIIDATSHYCIAYKPNTAFYEAEGLHGWQQFEMTVSYIRNNYPDMLIIADAKRGDIGNTAARYAEAFFKNLDCDAVTLAPYMGKDSIEPFLKYEGKWSIILAMTSNPSAEDFEPMIYEKVIVKSMEWGSKDNTMYVVGATRADMLGHIREICPDNFLLVPGVGAQGGSLEEVVKFGKNSHCGLIVNASRSIIYAGKGEDFALAAEKAASVLASQMSALL